MSEAIERVNASHPCKVCGGHPGLPRGKGVRCTGSEGTDILWCSREEYAYGLPVVDSDPPTYAHRARGDCLCGTRHGQPDIQLVTAPIRIAGNGWRIQDADGTEIGTHRRNEYSDGTKSYTWTWKADPRPPIEELLYGMELIRLCDPAWPVIIVEGEKSADALRRLCLFKLLVLGTVQGAPHAPAARVLNGLAGRRVWLWPDNDDVGREQMQKIAVSLLPIVKELRVITWGDKPKDDAADFVERGGTAVELRAVAEAAIITNAKMALSDSAWAAVVPHELKWLWHPYIPSGKFTWLEGNPGIGKSFVALAISTSVTHGLGMPGQEFTGIGNVLFLSAEDDIADTLLPRIIAMGADTTHMFSKPDLPFFFDKAGVVKLRETIAKYTPKLIVFDPLFAFLGGAVDINKANQAREVMWMLAQIADENELAIVGIRHLTKSGGTENRGLGSIDFAAASRSILLAGCDPLDYQSRAVVHIKSNLAVPGPSIGYTLSDGRFGWTGTTLLTKAIILGDTHGLDRAELRACADWLFGYLISPRLKSDVLRQAKPQGYSTAMVEQAGNEINVTRRTDPIHNQTYWSRPMP